MDLNNNKIRELLSGYLKGKLSVQESEQLEEWYSSFDKDLNPIFHGEEEERETYGMLLENIHQNLHLQQESPSLWRRFYSSKVMKVAAVVTVLFISAGLFYNRSRFYTSAESATAMNIVVVAPGKMKLIELADGTKIWLNSATKFGYPKHFSSKLREVALLEGEAFFEVAHEKNRPFIVHSKGINTQVLGTSFNINAYGFSKCVKVSVTTGKVGVSHGKELIGFLTPNEEIKYHQLSNKSTKGTTNSSLLNSWIDGAIVLDYVDFESLKSILFNNYSYILKGENKRFNQLHFSATIKKSDHIDAVMKLLSSINQTKYSIKDKTITMY